jgi:NAD-dependent dihydropyrimidine dehydrogenase PreA subunit
MAVKKYYNHYGGTDIRLLAYVPKKTRYSIDETKCIGCTCCIDTCPTLPKAIFESTVLATARYPEEIYAYAIDQTKCTGCGRCHSVCPSEPNTIYLSKVSVARPAVGRKGQDEFITNAPDVDIPGAKDLPRVPIYYTQT